MSEMGGFLGARYRLECREAGCSLTFCGAYEDILDEAVAHARRAHGARGGSQSLRDELRAWLRDDLATIPD